MNNRDRKRHEQRKARRAAAGVRPWDTEPDLQNTRMLVLPIDAGPQVRRIEIDTTDPIDAVVRWGRRALLEAAPVECLRVVTVTNWDNDERELLEIPEAREYARRLWAEGRPLLRLLSESMWSPVPDDSYGLPPEVLSAFGLGWLDVYLLGFCDVADSQPVETETGTVYRVGMVGMGPERRESLRAELLEVTDNNPAGVGFDAVRERAHLAQAHTETLYKSADELVQAGQLDHVLVIVSALDLVGRDLIVRLVGQEQARQHLERCRADDLHPAAVFHCPRSLAIEGIRTFAPQAAATIGEQIPPGEFWTLTVAGGGTQVGRIRNTEGTT